jgi:hypothetical protein
MLNVEGWRVIIKEWKKYNKNRPHSSLNYFSPRIFHSLFPKYFEFGGLTTGYDPFYGARPLKRSIKKQLHEFHGTKNNFRRTAGGISDYRRL